MIERQIVTGLIVSTEYFQQVRPIWNARFLESETAKKLALWCVEYFDKYHKAPGLDIESIYMEKLRTGELKKELAEDIENILSDLSDEYDETFNVKYILDKTNNYFRERHLSIHTSTIRELIDSGDPESVDEAQRLASSYKGISAEISDDLDLSDAKVLDKIEKAFTEFSEPLIKYPGALGAFWNHQLVRGGFIGLMGAEKRGKSFWLLDMAVRATRQKSKAAFFQAGDMTEMQQIKRTCSYVTQKPYRERDCGDIYLPVIDCIKNQLDTCEKKERECDFGPLGSDNKMDEKNIRSEITFDQLKELFEEEEDYRPCRNCDEFHKRPFGMPWLKKIHIKSPLDVNEAKAKMKEFFIKKKRRLRISTHINDSLTVSKIKMILDRWEREDGFIPDVIVVDYADILVTEKVKEFRHQQNQIWKELRALSQERNSLVITGTQSDAASYKHLTLKLSNYSEDKRKYGHVTGMYGLNQDKEGVSREKKLGLMRINELVIREGDFDTVSSVTVIQHLKLGRPFVGSYI